MISSCWLGRSFRGDFHAELLTHSEPAAQRALLLLRQSGGPALESFMHFMQSFLPTASRPLSARPAAENLLPGGIGVSGAGAVGHELVRRRHAYRRHGYRAPLSPTQTEKLPSRCCSQAAGASREKRELHAAGCAARSCVGGWRQRGALGRRPGAARQRSCVGG